MKILLVEDDKLITNIIKKGLTEHGFIIDCLDDGAQVLKTLELNNNSYDAIILDVVLPHTNGFEICKEIRSKDINVPILMLSVKAEIDDKVRGLEYGADDYLAKPFEMKELVARVKSLVKRKIKPIKSTVSVGLVTIHEDSMEVVANDKKLILTPTEFRILLLLMQNTGSVVTRSDILEKAWDARGDEIMSNSIDVHMNMLRRKLSDAGVVDFISTVRGVGFKITE